MKIRVGSAMQNLLSASQVENFTTRGKYADGGNLYLQVQVQKKGRVTRSWVFRYMAADGRRREKGLGSCADVSLAEARSKAAACREMVRDDLDPIEELQRQSKAFRQVAALAFKETQAGPSKRSRQELKSDHTRTVVLDAALECFGLLPHPEVTIAVVAERAGVSKGGIQYHFPSRRDLLREAVNRLFERRLQAYRSDLDNVPYGTAVTDYIIDKHWKHLSEPEFRIYQELLLASRSNPELRRLLVHRYKAFMREWNHLSLTSFGWNQADPEVGILGSIAQYLMDGMAYGWSAGQLNLGEVGPLLDFVKSLMRQGMRSSSTSQIVHPVTESS
ncbi:MAG: DUF4102 domain-containing protein [Gammaproteobacteria bacterium]|nr:DUF4102 domain-containing protein [Gammaproteobacteria bacterium]